MNVFSWIFTACNRRHVLDAVASLPAAITQLRQSTATANQALDHALTQLANARAQQAERDALACMRARAEFADAPEAFAALLGMPSRWSSTSAARNRPNQNNAGD